MQTRNSEVLADFVEYCEANPEQRFWQALRNWSDAGFILLVGAEHHYADEITIVDYDTFYREG